jgi:hypothetical protein
MITFMRFNGARPTLDNTIILASEANRFNAPATGDQLHSLAGLAIATLGKGNYSESAHSQVFTYQPSWGQGLAFRVDASFSNHVAHSILILSPQTSAHLGDAPYPIGLLTTDHQPEILKAWNSLGESQLPLYAGIHDYQAVTKMGAIVVASITDYLALTKDK